MVLETQIREEVSAEFMELFRNMQKDYRWVTSWSCDLMQQELGVVLSVCEPNVCVCVC